MALGIASVITRRVKKVLSLLRGGSSGAGSKSPGVKRKAAAATKGKGPVKRGK